jgi:hypothetical protein
MSPTERELLNECERLAAETGHALRDGGDPVPMPAGDCWPAAAPATQSHALGAWTGRPGWR